MNEMNEIKSFSDAPKTATTKEPASNLGLLTTAGKIVLIVTLTLSLIFYGIGIYLIIDDNNGSDDGDDRIYRTAYFNEYGSEYLDGGETLVLDFYPGDNDYVYIYVDNGYATNIQGIDGSYPSWYTYDTNVYVSGTYYDYCYRFLVDSYTTYNVEISGYGGSVEFYLATSPSL